MIYERFNHFLKLKFCYINLIVHLLNGNYTGSNLKQEAQGACGTLLVLANPLGFVVFFFLIQNYIYIWCWQLWNNSKYPVYAIVNCIVYKDALRAVVYKNKIILNLRYIFFYIKTCIR